MLISEERRGSFISTARMRLISWRTSIFTRSIRRFMGDYLDGGGGENFTPILAFPHRGGREFYHPHPNITPIPSTSSGQALAFPYLGGRELRGRG